MAIEHLKHESNGRTFKVTQDSQDTGQRVYKSFIGQKNVDLGSGDFAPYVWDEPSQSIRYSNKVCEFYPGGYQIVREFGSVETLIDDQRFEVQYWDDPQWRTLDLWQIGLTVNQQDDYCIVTRNLSDGAGNTLDVDFLFRPFEVVKNTFRLHVVNANLYRIRFQNSGIAGELVEIDHISREVNSGVYKLRFDLMEFLWLKDEIGIHENYTVEDQAGGKKLDIFIGDFDLSDNSDVIISPDQWGETAMANTNDDCYETLGGVDLDGYDAAGALCGYFGNVADYSCRWQNVTIDGEPASVDAGTQIEFDVGYSEGSFTPICYGLEGDTPAFNVTDPSTRTRTAASHSFTQPTVGTDRTISGSTFQAVVKEILDTSWSSGYAIGFTFDDNGAANGSDIQIEDYSTGTGARITIVYTPVSSSNYAFGEENPTEGETPESWATWSDGAAGNPTIIGDADWGQLKVQLNASGQSAVKDLGSTKNRIIVLTRDKYGSGSGSITIYIRGQAATFNQDDGSPAWEEYTTPINKDWRFIQTKVEYLD